MSAIIFKSHCDSIKVVSSKNVHTVGHFQAIFTGLPVRPSHKLGFRSSAAKNSHPGEGRHEGLVPRNDVLTNGFI